MGYRKLSQSGALKVTLAMKQDIEREFGKETIAQARLRLCAKCKVSNCFLYPICTDGKDCPYFQLKGELK